jgi:transposase, IS5 family
VAGLLILKHMHDLSDEVLCARWLENLGYTLVPVVAEMEKLTGIEVRRIYIDKGYRGHNHPHKFRVWTSGQVRRVTKAIRREMRRRAAMEPAIGHIKAEHRIGA